MTAVATRPEPALRPSTDPVRWDRYVAGHPDGTPFHLSGFLTVVADLFGLQAHLAEAELDGELVGVVPMLVRNRDPFALVNHGLHIPYLGPLLSSPVDAPAVLDAVRRYLRPRAVLHFGLKSIRRLRIPDSAGWWVMDGYERAVVPIGEKDADDLLALFTSQQRTALRRATREGLTVGPATREEIARSFTTWANEPFTRQGLAPRWPAGAHLAIHEALSPSGAALTTAVRRDDELLALSTDLLVGNRPFAWEMGLSEGGRARGAAALLFMAGMQRARRLNAAEYDLLGVPTPGIATFKRSLGAELRPCGAAQWVSPAVPVGKRLMDAARRMARPTGRRP